MESEGAKKNLNIEKITCPNEVLSNVYCQSKMKFLYIYGNNFTKYINGTCSLLNILKNFAIKEKSIILTHTMIFA